MIEILFALRPEGCRLRPRRGDERRHETRDVNRENVIAHLLPFVAKHSVLAALKIALHKVAEEAVQLDSSVVWPVRQPPRSTHVGKPK